MQTQFKIGDTVTTYIGNEPYKVLHVEIDKDSDVEWVTVNTPRGNREWMASQLRKYRP